MKTFYQLKTTIKTLIVLILVLSICEKTEASNYILNDISTSIVYKQYKGEILDSDSKKPLALASLSIENTNISTITNTEGEFILKVPEDLTNRSVVISFLGYTTQTIALSKLKSEKNKILMVKSITELNEISITVPKSAEELVKETLQKRASNYSDVPTLMTAFYRESIKKRKKNLSLSEAIVNIHKSPYNSYKQDVLKFYKTRKNTDYTKLDTLALKLQGGPFNTLFVDVMKYPEYIFTEETIPNYDFSYGGSTEVNNKVVYVIKFNQKSHIKTPLYDGELFIDPENKILTSAVFSLNTSNKREVAKMLVKQNNTKAKVTPTKANYRVVYKEKDNKWYYSYSLLNLEFKVDWKDKLFNSNYNMSCEMAVTDWEKKLTKGTPKHKDRVKSSIIMSDYAVGFSDPDFWGEHNIIEPDKSIKLAIKKIKKQLKKKSNQSALVN